MAASAGRKLKSAHGDASAWPGQLPTPGVQGTRPAWQAEVHLWFRRFLKKAPASKLSDTSQDGAKPATLVACMLLDTQILFLIAPALH